MNDNGIIFFDDIFPKNKNEQLIPVSSVIGPYVWKLIYHILIHKEKFDLKKIISCINMSSDCRGMLVMEFNKIEENNIFFKNMDDLASYYSYDNDFNKYKEILFNLESH